VRRAFASSLLSLLLLTTLVGGGCISCEEYFMFGGSKSCCSPDGHCKPKNSPTKETGRECNQNAFEHHGSINHHIELPVVATVGVEFALRAMEGLDAGHGANSIEPSPPDLQVLHSIFLI
jgi:hypothetical protein